MFIQQLTTRAIASGLEPLVEEARQNVALLKGELDKLKEEELVIMTEQQHTATTPGSSKQQRGCIRQSPVHPSPEQVTSPAASSSSSPERVPDDAVLRGQQS
jgi:hypothetical protein